MFAIESHTDEHQLHRVRTEAIRQRMTIRRHGKVDYALLYLHVVSLATYALIRHVPAGYLAG